MTVIIVIISLSSLTHAVHVCTPVSSSNHLCLNVLWWLSSAAAAAAAAAADDDDDDDDEVCVCVSVWRRPWSIL